MDKLKENMEAAIRCFQSVKRQMDLTDNTNLKLKYKKSGNDKVDCFVFDGDTPEVTFSINRNNVIREWRLTADLYRVTLKTINKRGNVK